MVPSKETTLKPSDTISTTATNRTGTTTSDVESDLGTLIINSESDEEESDKTLKPAFMQHFERTEVNKQLNQSNTNNNEILQQLSQVNLSSKPNILNSHDPLVPSAPEYDSQNENSTVREINTDNSSHQPIQIHQSPQNHPMLRAIMLEGDFEFLRYLSLEELRNRMATLDLEMETEIEELRRRYAAKRQPILDAMDSKKKRQQNF